MLGFQPQVQLGSGHDGGGKTVFVDGPPVHLREALGQVLQLLAGRLLQADLPGLQHDVVRERRDPVGFVAEVPFRALAPVGGGDDHSGALPRRQLFRTEAFGDEVLDVVEPEHIAAAPQPAHSAPDPLAQRSHRLGTRRGDQMEVMAFLRETAEGLEQGPGLAHLGQPVEDDQSPSAAVERFGQGFVQFPVGGAPPDVLDEVDVEMRLLPGRRIDPDLDRLDRLDRPDIDPKLIAQGDVFSSLLARLRSVSRSRPGSGR